jgi:hypothetical protein
MGTRLLFCMISSRSSRAWRSQRAKKEQCQAEMRAGNGNLGALEVDVQDIAKPISQATVSHPPSLLTLRTKKVAPTFVCCTLGTQLGSAPQSAQTSLSRLLQMSGSKSGVRDRAELVHPKTTCLAYQTNPLLHAQIICRVPIYCIKPVGTSWSAQAGPSLSKAQVQLVRPSCAIQRHQGYTNAI